MHKKCTLNAFLSTTQTCETFMLLTDYLVPINACLFYSSSGTNPQQYLQAVPVTAAELQQTLPGGSGRRGQRESPLHVHRSLAQLPLNAVRLVQLLHLRRQTEITPQP